MKILEVKYSQFENTKRQWTLENCSLDKINLIVGKNASGKSKTLSLIIGLSNILSGRIKINFLTGSWLIKFDNNGSIIEYTLNTFNKKVTKEKLVIDKKVLLNRKSSGKGRIYYEQLKKDLDFQCPHNEVATVARRDKIQHSFFEILYKWATDFRAYHFGTPLGKLNLLIEDKSEIPGEVDFKNYETVVRIFKEGFKEFKQSFKNAIINDMNQIGYPLDDIMLAPLTSLILEPQYATTIVGLHVKESDLLSVTDQNEMSQGMFRVLSLIIQLNYIQMSKTSCCVVIDDIGEGLDFERSTTLIKVLIDKAEKSYLQLIMSSNDRFVMNNVELKYWAVIKRVGNKSIMYNYRNSKEKFDYFEFTGLNNFDFFSRDFIDEEVNQE